MTDAEDSESDTASMMKIANAYNILRKAAGIYRIYLTDFCLFHVLMARPDPEVDIAFLLMDRKRRGFIDLDDFKVS